VIVLAVSGQFLMAASGQIPVAVNNQRNFAPSTVIGARLYRGPCCILRYRLRRVPGVLLLAPSPVICAASTDAFIF
jgi:hypothetical protein